MAGGGCKLGRGGGGGGFVDVKSWSKMLFLGFFGKLLHIGRPWMNVLVRVLQKVAEIRVIIYKIYSIFMDFMYKK